MSELSRHALSRLVASFVILMLGAGGAAAGGFDKRLSVGFNACLEGFPDAQTGVDNVRALGWRSEGRGKNSAFNLLTLNGRRLFVATGTEASGLPGCFASQAGWTQDEALEFAEHMAQVYGLSRVEVANAPAGAVWLGVVNGTSATLNVIKSRQWRFHRGAAVMLNAGK